MIKQAAILKEGKIYVGKGRVRHDEIFYSQPEGFFTGDNMIMGFVTDEGKFLNRKEAATYAFKCGQMKKDCGSLMSEDLY